MTISGDYPRPITVNGFQCHNCAEVSKAKRNIDPAEGKPGSIEATGRKSVGFAEQSFTLDGRLAGHAPDKVAAVDHLAAGQLIDLRA